MRLKMLRFFLGLAALTWGVSIAGVFITWDMAAEVMQAMGARDIRFDRMLDYWLRMASGAFALLGCWYLVLMIAPRKFASVIPWFGILMLVEGCILLFHGMRLSLPPLPFYGDVAACFIAGAGILFFSRCDQEF